MLQAGVPDNEIVSPENAPSKVAETVPESKKFVPIVRIPAVSCTLAGEPSSPCRPLADNAFSRVATPYVPRKGCTHFQSLQNLLPFMEKRSLMIRPFSSHRSFVICRMEREPATFLRISLPPPVPLKNHLSVPVHFILNSSTLLPSLVHALL